MDSKKSLIAACACAAPLCVGAVLSTSGESTGFMPPCPFRTLLGIPCPFCGGTRAVVYFMHADTRFWNYNFLWPFVLIFGTIYFLVEAVRLHKGKEERAVSDKAVFTLIALGWLVAFYNMSYIV